MTTPDIDDDEELIKVTEVNGEVLVCMIHHFVCD